MRLVGIESLSDRDRITMNTARMLREDYLQQNAYDTVDTFTSFNKQTALLTNILYFDEKAQEAIQLGAYLQDVMGGTVELRDRIARSKFIEEERLNDIENLKNEIETTLRDILQSGGDQA